MGRSALGARGCAAAALMASCFMVTASAQQASVPSAPAGSTPDATQQPQASGGQGDSVEPQEAAELPISLDRVRKGLAHEPVLRLDSQPVFRLAITERRPRYWDLQSPFLFAVEPRTSTTRWHDEFRSMVTPTEATMYGSMLSQSETATIAATSLLFAGAASLVKAGISEWKQSRRDGKARAAREEVDEALAAWALANEK
jgi:hypothetical protein